MQEPTQVKRCCAFAAPALILLSNCATAMQTGAPAQPRRVQLPRPELASAFVLRNHAPVVTFQISGEDIREAQVTLYRDGTVVRAIIIEADDSETGYSERTISSAENDKLRLLYQSFSTLKVSPLPDDTLYLPAMGIQVWTTGLSSESIFRLKLPSELADSAAYWGERSDRDRALVEWVRGVMQALSLRLRSNR